MRFSRGVQGKSKFSFKTSKMKILSLNFCQNQLKVEKPIKMAIFGPTSLIIEWSRFFSEKNAVHVSYPYSKEHSCKKAKKSLEPESQVQNLINISQYNHLITLETILLWRNGACMICNKHFANLRPSEDPLDLNFTVFIEVCEILRSPQYWQQIKVRDLWLLKIFHSYARNAKWLG